jgi:hypothetical protein
MDKHNPPTSHGVFKPVGHVVIEHIDDEPQVAESPDRGLDAQTPSGREGERALRRRRP